MPQLAESCEGSKGFVSEFARLYLITKRAATGLLWLGNSREFRTLQLWSSTPFARTKSRRDNNARLEAQNTHYVDPTKVRKMALLRHAADCANLFNY